MSARRLADEQPASFAFSPQTMEQVRFWLGKFPEDRKASAVLPILWLVQQQEGWVSEPAIRATADLLGMPNIRVLEVATFYTMLRLKPAGRYHLQVCGTTPCVLRGAEELKKFCHKRIGEKFDVTVDGNFSWEEVECMGACVNAPIVAINDRFYEDLTAEDLQAIVERLARGEKVPPGSARGRQTSAPEGGPLTLKDSSLYDGSLAEPLSLPNRPVPA